MDIKKEIDNQRALGNLVYFDFHQRQLKKSFRGTKREVDGQGTVGALP